MTFNTTPLGFYNLIKRSFFILLICLPVFLNSCGSDQGTSHETDLEDPFPSVHVQEIFIEVEPALWEEIRHTARDPEILIPLCGEEAEVSPYDYVSANVTIDGESIQNVGLRTKGWWGSINATRPSLKLKLDEFETNQNYHGTTRMTLNNNNHDPSRMRTCLAMETFRRVGYPASQSGYAHVTVNGKDMGVYSSVESIKSPFLEKWFTSDEGNLYESQLADFVPDGINRYERKNNDETADDRFDIEAVVTALEADDEDLLDELSTLIDLDRFYTYWALEVLISFWDGYNGNKNNHYIYNDPETGRFVFIPWGPDDAFKSKSSFLNVNSVGPLFANATLSNRLYGHPEGRAMFIAELARLYDIVYGDDLLLREVQHVKKALAPFISDEFNPDFGEGVEELQTFLSSHPTAISRTLLNETPPDYPYDVAYRCSPDMPEEHSFSISFSTTYGTPDFKGGTIDSFDVDGLDPEDATVYFFPVYSGFEDFFYSATASPTLMSDIGGIGNVKLSFLEINFSPEPPYSPLGDLAGIILNVPQDRFLAGGTIDLVNLSTTAMVIYISDYAAASPTVFGGLMTSGTLTLTESGMNDGDRVSGIFEGNLVLFSPQ